MAEIKFIKAVAGKDFTYQAGEVLALPEKEAKKWCDIGFAMPVATAKPVQKRTATSKRAKTREKRN